MSFNLETFVSNEMSLILEIFLSNKMSLIAGAACFLSNEMSLMPRILLSNQMDLSLEIKLGKSKLRYIVPSVSNIQTFKSAEKS